MSAAPNQFDPYVLVDGAPGEPQALSADGSGATYRARDTRQGRDVFIRIFSEKLLADAATQREFVENARWLIELDHPGITRIIDTGNAGDQFYYVLEDPGGGLVEEIVSTSGPLDPTRALSLLIPLLEALSVVRARPGVLSRISPRNLLLIQPPGSTPHLKVLAQNVIGPLEPIEQPEYLAPEILVGHRENEPSMLYSLGATLFFVLAGKPPFSTGLSLEELVELKSTTQPDLTGLPPGIPYPLLRQMLAPDPGNRPQSIEIFERALRRFLQFAPGTPVGSSAPAGGGPLTPSPMTPPAAPFRFGSPASPGADEGTSHELQHAKEHTQRLSLELTKRVQKELALKEQLEKLETELKEERARVRELTARHALKPGDPGPGDSKPEKSKFDDEWAAIQAARETLEREKRDFLKKTQRFSISQLSAEAEAEASREAARGSKAADKDSAKPGPVRSRFFRFGRQDKSTRDRAATLLTPKPEPIPGKRAESAAARSESPAPTPFTAKPASAPVMKVPPSPAKPAEKGATPFHRKRAEETPTPAPKRPAARSSESPESDPGAAGNKDGGAAREPAPTPFARPSAKKSPSETTPSPPETATPPSADMATGPDTDAPVVRKAPDRPSATTAAPGAGKIITPFTRPSSESQEPRVAASPAPSKPPAGETPFSQKAPPEKPTVSPSPKEASSKSDAATLPTTDACVSKSASPSPFSPASAEQTSPAKPETEDGVSPSGTSAAKTPEAREDRAEKPGEEAESRTGPSRPTSPFVVASTTAPSSTSTAASPTRPELEKGTQADPTEQALKGPATTPPAKSEGPPPRRAPGTKPPGTGPSAAQDAPTPAVFLKPLPSRPHYEPLSGAWLALLILGLVIAFGLHLTYRTFFAAAENGEANGAGSAGPAVMKIADPGAGTEQVGPAPEEQPGASASPAANADTEMEAQVNEELRIDMRAFENFLLVQDGAWAELLTRIKNLAREEGGYSANEVEQIRKELLEDLERKAQLSPDGQIREDRQFRELHDYLREALKIEGAKGSGNANGANSHRPLHFPGRVLLA